MKNFQENFHQWGIRDAIVVLGNNSNRVRILDIYEEDNQKKVIVSVLGSQLQTAVNTDELMPDYCRACEKHCYSSLICCEGCQHRQCMRCMEEHKHRCVICQQN